MQMEEVTPRQVFTQAVRRGQPVGGMLTKEEERKEERVWNAAM